MSPNAMRITAKAALFSTAAPIVFFIIATIATLAAPNYSSIKSTLSELGIPANPHSWIINLAFIAYAMLVQGLGPALYTTAASRISGLAIWLLVAVYGAGGVSAGLFATKSTQLYVWGITEGEIHGAAAWVTFSAICSLMVITPLVHRADPSWLRWRRYSIWLAIVTAVAILLFLLKPSSLLHGVFQRSFFATTMLWVLVTSLEVRRSVRTHS